MNVRYLALAGIAIIGAISCGKDTPVSVPPPPPAVPPPPPPPPAPAPGPLTVSLTTTPNTDDGALLLELKGPSIRTVTAKNAAIQVYADTMSTTTVRTVVAGNLTTGGLFTFQVPDARAAASYTVTIVDIADRQNRVRNGNSGYTLTIAP
jgi:hypothetical protein